MGKNCVNSSAKTGFLSSIKTYLDSNRLGELLVLKGVIDSAQLRDALSQQKQAQQPLGYVLVQNNHISKRQLRSLLLRQRTMRLMATGLMCFMALSFTTKRANAAAIKDVAAQISVVGTTAEFTKVAYYPALFGSSEKRSSNISAFTKWSDMFKRFERSLKKGNNPELIKWQTTFRQYKGQSLKQMASNVNTLVNKTRYITDQRNYGKSDYWSTPIEFLKRGGDCEDFAIAKYTALRALGVPEERLRVAIVQDKVKNIPHAILIVYTDTGALYLDNQSQYVSKASNQQRYRPIFSINRTAWWLHTAPSATRVASLH